jgi:hypothetical protein
VTEKLTSHILALEIIALLKIEFVILWYTGVLKKSISLSMTSMIHDIYLKVNYTIHFSI